MIYFRSGLLTTSIVGLALLGVIGLAGYRSIATLQSENRALKQRIEELTESVEELAAQAGDCQSPTDSARIDEDAGEEPNVFRFSDVQPGDKVAELTVTSVGPVDESSGARDPLDSDAPIPNASVRFSGQVVVTGYYTAVSEARQRELADEAGYYNPSHRVCMREIDKDSAARLPQMAGDSRSLSFCFRNIDEAAAALGEDTEGKATVVIDDYTINVFPSEVTNYARLVEVQEIHSLPPAGR